MNKKQLKEFREDIARVLDERRAAGEFDANSKHIMMLLRGMLNLADHAIAVYPKPERKK